MISTLIPLVSSTVAVALAFAVLVRGRRTADRWAFTFGMLALAAESVFAWLSARAELPETMMAWQRWTLLAASFLPATWLFFSVRYARGDVPRAPAAVRLLWLAAAIVPASFVIIFWSDLLTDWRYAGPQNEWLLRLGWPALLLNAVLLLGAVGVLTNLERTYRSSAGTMRWRIKYMILGVGLIFIAQIYTSSQAVLFRDVAAANGMLGATATLLGGLLILRSMFRTGHFEIQVYPSRSILQGSVTVLVAGAYLLIVGLFAKVVAHIGGDTRFEYKALLVLVVLVLFVVVLQSDRVRLQVRRLVSRHFRRPVHDYRTVWHRFSQGTAMKMDETDVSRALVRLIADLFQALSVTIWLVDESSGTVTLAASTSLDEHLQDAVTSPRIAVADVIAHLRSNPEPANFETDPAPWAAGLRAWHPSEFNQGGGRVCVPIIAQGEMLGIIAVGDRVGGAIFTLQDFDMLKCVAEHAAASLLNAHLSKEFLQAKELESFQAMAAFFIHDLKNAASTLNLMLKNMPDHFDDPAFRADALRGMSKTVAHINELTGRLNVLRQELKINRRQTNLHELIASTVATVSLGPTVDVVQELAPVPPMNIDSELIGKVLLNLLLNASEAMAGSGKLRIAAQQSNGCSLVSVTDTGCGMSPDFIRRSLFRPFQTTKKNGLGIGMFQCKAIVEAHGGRIAVSSEPGKGTTVQIFLPVSPASRGADAAGTPHLHRRRESAISAGK